MALQGFTDRLRAARAAAALTQSQVALALGCTYDTVGNYEHGRTEPRITTLRRLATLYQVSIDWLVSGVVHLPNRIAAPSDRCRHLIPHADRCGACEKTSKVWPS